MCRSRKVMFHTDAAQGVGKIPIDVNDLKIDLMSISGHKIYGPKGKVLEGCIISLGISKTKTQYDSQRFEDRSHFDQWSQDLRI